MIKPLDQGQPEDEPAERSRGVDWQWIVTALGLALAAAALFFTPALPFKLDTATSVALLAATLAAGLWFGHKLRQWRQHPHRKRPRGVWVAAGTALALFGLFMVAVIPQEESGYINAHCTFGVQGLGLGMVWAKIEPRDTGSVHTVTVRWGGWVGRPKPVRLDEATYFTFLKRDWRSGPADVSVDPPARLTCGDGRSPSDRPSIHLVGGDWTREPRPTTSPTPPVVTASPSPATSALNQVVDGGDPGGCTSDARRAHEQAVFTLAGKSLGTLQLVHSLNCNAMWGRLAVVADGQPPDGWEVTLTLVRSGDARNEVYRKKIYTTAFYTGLLRDDGSCFTVQAVIVTAQGEVRVHTPCKR